MTTTARRYRIWGILPLVGALAAAGCADAQSTGQPDEEQPGVAQAPLTEAPAPVTEGKEEGKEPRRGHPGKRAGMDHHRGGPAMLLRLALAELDLTDAQKSTIKSSMAGLRDKKGEVGPRHEAVMAALAQGVRAGKVDEALVLSKATEGLANTDAHRDQLSAALKALHETLTKEQRAQLVTLVNERMEEHGDKGNLRGRRADGDAKRAEGDRPGADRAGKHGPFGHLLRGIEIRDDQRARIDEAVKALRPAAVDRDAMKEKMEAKREEMRTRLATFANDAFDAKAFVAPPDGDHEGPKAHLSRMVKAVAAIVPILEPAQREQLADRLEAGPALGKRGPKGARGPRRELQTPAAPAR